MNNLPKVFDFNDNPVRVLVDHYGRPWWVAKDVCDVLGLSNSRKALSALDEDEKSTVTISDGTSGNPYQSIVNEPGLYSLILRSRKPQAKAFKRWITHEVIPAIRETGSYSVTNAPSLPDFNNPAVAARAWADQFEARLLAEQKAQVLEIETIKNQPKVETFDRAMNSDTTLRMGDVAKVLNYNGFGRNNLFRFLRENGVLMAGNIPYQEYVKRGYFRVVERNVAMNSGNDMIKLQTYVYQKGLDFIRKLLDEHTGVEKQRQPLMLTH